MKIAAGRYRAATGAAMKPGNALNSGCAQMTVADAQVVAQQEAGKLLFNRILCPVDFEGVSRAAIEAACDAARGPRPVIYLLHVVRVAPALGGVPLEPYGVTRHDVEMELQQMIPAAAPEQIRFELVARKGDAVKEILRAIAELGVDSVVMATRGRAGVGRLLLGSVAGKVVREAPCPVLTVR